MNQFLPSILAVCLIASSIGTLAFAQQTPINTNCSDSSVIVWNKNPERDMQSYRLYSKSTAGITKTDVVLVTVDHKTGTVIWNNQGIAQFHEKFNSGWTEGNIWFAVSAVDVTGNESGMSSEIGCRLDITPGIPTGMTIASQIKQWISKFLQKG